MRRPTLPTTFRGRLLLIGVVAFAVRAAHVLITRRELGFGDALVYWIDAQHLAAGEGFRHPFDDTPSAEHPPLHILLLAGLDVLGIDGYQRQKIVLCALGAVTVVLIGLLACRVAGERAGLIAAGLAAVYPNLVMADGTLMSETLYLAFLLGALLLAWRLAERADGPRMALLGGVIALAALTRGEGIALVVLLLVPLAVAGGATWPARARLAAFGVAGLVLVLAPWTIRNLATFEEPVLISNNGNAVFVGANCDRTYYGDLIGSWAFSCYGQDPPGDESQRAIAYRERGLEYIADNLGRLPVVVAARAGRALELYRPGQGVFLQTTEGRSAPVARAGIVMFWALALLAVAGALALGVRRLQTWVLLAPIAMATATCLAVYASTRLRIAAEPSLVILAAVTLDRLAARHGARLPWRRPARGAPPQGSAPAA